jgi:hypothetical protein
MDIEIGKCTTREFCMCSQTNICMRGEGEKKENIVNNNLTFTCESGSSTLIHCTSTADSPLSFQSLNKTPIFS